MKFGNTPEYLMLRNDSGVEQTFSFLQASGAQGDLSHSFGLGTPGNQNNDDEDPMNPVPLPASGWLLLAGLAGIGAMSRRRKSKV